MNLKAAFLILIAAFNFHSCKNRTGNPEQKKVVPVKEHLLKANKIVVENESELVENYIKRHQWPVQVSGTGLRYYIYKKGNGHQPNEGSTVKIKYTVAFLDGTMCYDSTETEPLEFVVGRSEQISGLHEVVKYMHQGDKAKVIIPPHLGYGLLGDGDKIPSKAVLVFDLELLNVKQ